MSTNLKTNRNTAPRNRNRFFELRYVPHRTYSRFIAALEKHIGVKVKFTSAYRLYGYEIHGGGIISKCPRFRTKEQAELEVVRLLVNMSDLGRQHFQRLFTELTTKEKAVFPT